MDPIVHKPSSTACLTSSVLHLSLLRIREENSTNERSDRYALCLRIISSDDISRAQCDKMTNEWSTSIVWNKSMPILSYAVTIES